VQWQQDLAPTASMNGVVLNSVRQTSAGGYIAAGNYYVPNSQGLPLGQVLVAAFGSTGSLSWQEGFTTVSSGTLTSNSDVTSVIQTSDGGYAVAGGWTNGTFNGGNGASGALLLKLGSTGSLQWQQAYSGGVYQGRVIGSFAYSLYQISDGDYVLAGDEDIEQPEVTIEPWVAEVSSAGSLVWEHQYYQVYTKTGLPLSENFSGAASPRPPGSWPTGRPRTTPPGSKSCTSSRRTAPATWHPAATSTPARRCRPSALS